MPTKKLSKKVLLSLGALGAAGAIAGMGTFATFTSTTSATQSVSSGTVQIALATSGAANRLSVAATNVVPGDTIQRAVDLTSTSSEGLASVQLTTTAPVTSSLLNTDATNGLQMVIQECSVAWTESNAVTPTYTCGGDTTTALAAGPVIRATASLDATVVDGPGTSHLMITLTLPSTAGNTFQTLSSVVNYEFTATQRAAGAR